MDRIVLHSFRRCPFAIRVRMVLEEKQIPYLLLEENLRHFSAELLALHPEGKVPLLVHHFEGSKQVVFQSTIITEYLDETFPKSPLMPKDPVSRVQVRLWTHWCDYIFKPDLDLFKYKLSNLTEVQITDLVSRLHTHFAKWEKQFTDSPFLFSGPMTLADVHLFPFARQFFSIKQSEEWAVNYPKVYGWLGRIVARPSFQRVMSKTE